MSAPSQTLDTKRAGRAGTWAVMDQGLISATNFFTGWVLARNCEPAEYGAWAVVFSALLLLQALQTTLITQPLMVLGPQRGDGERAPFAGALAFAQAGLTLILTVAAFGTGALLSGPVAPVALSMALVLIPLQGHEYLRRVLYSHLRTDLVLANDVVSCGLQVAGMALLWRWDLLSGANAFLVAGGAACAGWLAGYLQARNLLGWDRHGWRGSLREAWSFGRWGIGSVAGDSLLQQGTLLSVVTLTGTAGSALVEAPRLLLAPLNILIFSGNNMLTPMVADHLKRNGAPALPALLRKMALLWLIPIAGYPLLVALAPEFWLGLAYGDRYSGAGDMVRLWALSQCLYGLRALPWIFVNVQKRADLLMYASLATGLVAFALAPPLIRAVGPGGAVMARIVADVAMLALAGIALDRLFRRAAPVAREVAA